MATMSFEAFRISVPLADNKEWAKTMVRISSLYSWGISKCSPPPLHFMPCIHSIIQYINHFLLQCSCDMSWVSSFIMHICTSMALLVSSLLLFASHYGDKTATIKTAVDGLFSWNMYDSFRSPAHIYRMANFLFHFFFSHFLSQLLSIIRVFIEMTWTAQKQPRPATNMPMLLAYAQYGVLNVSTFIASQFCCYGISYYNEPFDNINKIWYFSY